MFQACEKYAVVCRNYSGEPTEKDPKRLTLPLKMGTLVIIKGEHSGWCKGCPYPERKGGFLPMDCLHVFDNKKRRATTLMASSSNNSGENVATQLARSSTKLIKNVATGISGGRSEEKEKKEKKHELLDFAKYEKELDISWWDEDLSWLDMKRILDCVKDWSQHFQEGKEDSFYERIYEIESKIFHEVSKLKAMGREGDEQILETTIETIFKYIEEGCCFLGDDVVVRHQKGKFAGSIADETNTPISKLYRMHWEAQKKNEEYRQEISVSKSGVRTGDSKKKDIFPIVFGGRGTRQVSKNTERETVKEFYNLPESNMQFYFRASQCIFSIEEKVEVYVSLYSGKEKRFLSENFLINISSDAGEVELSPIAGQTLFKDIGARDFKSEMYIVFRVYRKGNVLKDFSTIDTTGAQKGKQKLKVPKNLNHDVRRPYGVAVIEISPTICESLVSGETIIPTENIELYAPKHMKNIPPKNEDHFISLHQALIDNNCSHVGLKDVELLPPCETKGIGMTLRLFIGEYDEVLSKHPALKGIPITPLMSFPEIISPGDLRNDVYVTLNSVNISNRMFDSIDTKNILVHAKVFGDGESTPMKCITPARMAHDSETDTFVSTVYYHIGNPKFNETFRISIDPKKLESSSLVFIFFKCPSRHNGAPTPFAFTYWRFSNDKGLYQEPSKPFDLYRYNKKCLDDVYSFSRDAEARSRLVNNKATMSITMKIVSTRVTRDEHLKNLLNWQNVKGKSIEDILKEFLYLKVDENVTFLREIFESLFSILSENDENEKIAQLIYNTLVTYTGFLLTTQNQFARYREILDEYIAKYLKSQTAYKWILHFISTNLNVLKEKDETKMQLKPLADTMKALNYLFQYMVASRIQYEKDLDPTKLKEDRDDFENSISDIMSSINLLISKSSPPAVIAAQGNLLKFMNNFFDSVAQVMQAKKVGQIVKDFLGCLPTSDSAKKNLIQGKLNTLKFIVKGRVMHKEESRVIILPKVIEQIQLHYNNDEAERTACTEIIMGIVRTIQELGQENKEIIREGVRTLFGLVPLLITSMDSINHEKKTIEDEIQELQKQKIEREKSEEEKDEHSHTQTVAGSVVAKKNPKTEVELKADLVKLQKKRADIISILLSILYIYDESLLQYQFEEDEKIAAGLSIKTIQDFFSLYRLILSQDDCIPPSWINFSIFMYSTLLKSMSSISVYFCKYFLSEERFDHSLWEELFKTVFKLAYTPQLELESMQSIRKIKFLTKVGDLRKMTFTYLYEVWMKLGTMQHHFVPALINPVMKAFSLIKNQDIHEVCLTIYHSILERDFEMHKTLSASEGATQRCVAEAKVDELFKKSFIDGLEKKAIENTPISEEVKKLIQNLRNLLLLVEEIQKYDQRTEEDAKTTACIKVMTYFLSHNNIELYLTYFHTLSKMHTDLENYIEAALSLKPHADRLDFHSTKLLPYFSDEYPEEMEKTRKERLFRRMIELYDKGKDWERAIQLSKELRKNLEENYDYTKMEELLVKEGKFYTNIMTKKRFFAEYYFVRFLGKGWKEKRGKYVYRGKELEKIMDFIAKLKKRYPNAEHLKKMNEEFDDQDGMWFYLDKITPATEEDLHLLPPDLAKEIHPRIKKYLSENNVRIFTVARRFKLSKEKLANEYADMAREVVFFFTEESFPSIRRVMPVVKEESLTLDPLLNACRDIEDKVNEIHESVVSHKIVMMNKDLKDLKPDTNGLSMLLNGTIDAAVNGGIKNYISAFFNVEYLEKNPHNLPTIKRFQSIFKKQVTVLSEALAIRRKFTSGKALELSEYLEKMFENMKILLDDVSAKDYEVLLRESVKQKSSSSPSNEPENADGKSEPSKEVKEKSEGNADDNTLPQNGTTEMNGGTSKMAENKGAPATVTSS